MRHNTFIILHRFTSLRLAGKWAGKYSGSSAWKYVASREAAIDWVAGYLQEPKKCAK